MRKKYKLQEMYLQNIIRVRQIGIYSRLTAYLMYRCEELSQEQEKLEMGKIYKHKK